MQFQVMSNVPSNKTALAVEPCLGWALGIDALSGDDVQFHASIPAEYAGCLHRVQTYCLASVYVSIAQSMLSFQ